MKRNQFPAVLAFLLTLSQALSVSALDWSKIVKPEPKASITPFDGSWKEKGGSRIEINSGDSTLSFALSGAALRIITHISSAVKSDKWVHIKSTFVKVESANGQMKDEKEVVRRLGAMTFEFKLRQVSTDALAIIRRDPNTKAWKEEERLVRAGSKADIASSQTKPRDVKPEQKVVTPVPKRVTRPRVRPQPAKQTETKPEPAAEVAATVRTGEDPEAGTEKALREEAGPDVKPTAAPKVTKDVLVTRAREAMARDAFEECTGLTRQALDVDKHCVEAWYLLGMAYKAQGRTEEEVSALEQVIAIDPRHVNACINLGNAYNTQGRYHEASQVLRPAVKLAPGDPASHCNLADAYRGMGAIDKAEANYRRAIKVNTDFAPALRGLAMIWLKKGNGDKAEECFRKYAELRPDDENFRKYLAALRAKVRQDIQGMINSPAVTEADEADKEMIRVIKRIDESEDRTIGGRWGPNHAVIRDKLLVRMKKVTAALREVRSETRYVQEIIQAYVRAHDQFEDFLRDIEHGVRLFDMDLFNRASIGPGGKTKQEGLRLLRELSARCAEGKGPLPLAARWVTPRQDLKAYLKRLESSQAEATVHKLLKRIVAIEEADRQRNKTIRRTWRPHLKELEETWLPQIEKAVLTVRRIRPQTSVILEVHTVFQDAVEGFELALRTWIRAIKADDSKTFTQGSTVMRQATESRSLAVSKMKGLGKILDKIETEETALAKASSRLNLLSQHVAAGRGATALQALPDLRKSLTPSMREKLRDDLDELELNAILKDRDSYRFGAWE